VQHQMTMPHLYRDLVRDTLQPPPPEFPPTPCLSHTRLFDPPPHLPPAAVACAPSQLPYLPSSQQPCFSSLPSSAACPWAAPCAMPGLPQQQPPPAPQAAAPCYGYPPQPAAAPQVAWPACCGAAAAAAGAPMWSPEAAAALSMQQALAAVAANLHGWPAANSQAGMPPPSNSQNGTPLQGGQAAAAPLLQPGCEVVRQECAGSQATTLPIPSYSRQPLPSQEQRAEGRCSSSPPAAVGPEARRSSPQQVCSSQCVQPQEDGHKLASPSGGGSSRSPMKSSPAVRERLGGGSQQLSSSQQQGQMGKANSSRSSSPITKRSAFGQSRASTQQSLLDDEGEVSPMRMRGSAVEQPNVKQRGGGGGGSRASAPQSAYKQRQQQAARASSERPGDGESSPEVPRTRGKASAPQRLNSDTTAGMSAYKRKQLEASASSVGGGGRPASVGAGTPASANKPGSTGSLLAKIRSDPAWGARVRGGDSDNEIADLDHF